MDAVNPTGHGMAAEIEITLNARSCATIDRALQRFAGPELCHLSRRNSGGLACLRVPSLAGGALSDLELADTRQADLVALAERVLQMLDQRGDRLSSLCLGYPCPCGDGGFEVFEAHGGCP